MAGAPLSDIAGVKVLLFGNLDESADRIVQDLDKLGIEAASYASVEAALEADRPHVVVYLNPDDFQNLEILKDHFHTSRFVLITTPLSDASIVGTLGRSIYGWMMPWEPLGTIISGILLVCRGGAAFSICVLAVLQREAQVSGEPGLPLASTRLTRRQVEILQLVSRGYTDKDIASTLTLSVRTVQRHMQDILHALNVHSRDAAVKSVLGLVPPPVSRGPTPDRAWSAGI